MQELLETLDEVPAFLDEEQAAETLGVPTRALDTEEN